LRFETLVPVRVHWSVNNWLTTKDTNSRDTQIGVHVTDLPTETLPIGTQIVFTFLWPDADRWEQHNYSVLVTGLE
jgi:glucoamylase